MTTAADTTLVGRERELEAIGRPLLAAREGRSGVLVVRGVAGVGKTALLDAAAGAAAGFRVLRAQGVQSESELAFAGLHQLLRPLTPLLDRLAPSQRGALDAAFGLAGEPAGDRFLIAAGALALLAEAAEEQPLLCAIDDLQWIDRPSVDALVFVARRLEAEAIAFVLALREGEPLPPGLDRFERLTLGGLARADARAVLERSARLAPAERERILDAAEGIPLALLELPRGGAEMGAVEGAFAERLAALPPRTRAAVLLAAADDDPDGRTALLALLDAEVSADDLAAAEAAGLLAVGGERVAFRHPLVRSAAYGSASFAERRAAHAALAAALSTPADADRRAWHRAAAAAGPDAEVATELAESAERARQRGGHAAAAAALERSARLTSDEPLRARRLAAAAVEAWLSGDVERADRLAGETLQLASGAGAGPAGNAGRGDRRGDDALQLAPGAGAGPAGNAGRADPRGDEALQPAPGAGAGPAGNAGRADRSGDDAPRPAVDPEVAAEATAVRGVIRAHRGDPGEAADELAAAARVLAARQPRRALRTALLAGEAAAYSGRHARGQEIVRWAASMPVADAEADRALVAFAQGAIHVFASEFAAAGERFLAAAELAERAGDPQALLWSGAGAVYAGDLLASRRVYARSVSAARALGAAGLVATALQFVANVELIEGRPALARTDAAEGLALALESGEDGAAANCRALLAWHAALRGEEERCRELAAEALEWTASLTMRPAVESAQRALALLDLGLGRFEAASDRLAALVRDPGAHPARRLLATGDLVEAAAGCGRTELARAALDDFAAWSEATASAWGEAIVAGAELQLARDVSEAAYERALRAHTAIELPFERGRLELRYGELLRRARRRVDARGHLRAALDRFAQLGAAPWERRAAAELRATGETARRRDVDTLDDLTPQELQIARMVAEGATNRDVAGRLFLSTRTVDYHLRKVFQKLGVSSRTQLAGIDW